MNKINYLEDHIISKLLSYRLKSDSIAEGFYKGVHQSKQKGFNVEFKEHREYNLGDEIKDIDWKIYAKREKLFIREHEEELDINTVILLDNSSSMAKTSLTNISKLEYCKYFITCLSFLLTKQGDKVSVFTFSKDVNNILSTTNQSKKITLLNEHFNSLLFQPYTSFKNIEKQIIPYLKGKTLLFIFSDFISQQDEIYSFLKKINLPKVEVILWHIQNEIDIDFPFKGDLIFVDPESGKEISLNASGVKEKYIKLFTNFKHNIKQLSNEQNIQYYEIMTNKHYSEWITHFLIHLPKLKKQIN